jgi:hypothetical protein
MDTNMLARKRSAYPIYQQVAAINRMFPGSCKRRGKHTLKCRCQITPSNLSTTYTVEIKYKVGRSPRVYVRKPTLIPCPKGKLPHVYAPDNRLCLFYPEDRSSTDQMLLADTILPWTSEWLFYYELWSVNGYEWLGGGIEH